MRPNFTFSFARVLNRTTRAAKVLRVTEGISLHEKPVHSEAAALSRKKLTIRPTKNFICGLCLILVLSSCGSCSLEADSGGGRGYTFLSYNLHNLFDDARDGTEYAEFDPSGGKWTPAKYRKKLEAAGKVILSSAPDGPDFVACVEIENDKALDDLARGPLSKAGYRWGATLPTEGAAIRVGFLSRFPVRDIRGHTPPSSGFPQRSFLELTLDAAGETVTVFICHFKAKTEGDAATENSRRLAADTLVKRIAEIAAASDTPPQIIVLGDLNENIDEYERKSGAYPTALMPAAAAVLPAQNSGLFPLYVTGEKSAASFAAPLVFYSPWLDDPPHPGSYYYHGWETIDHALLSAGLVDASGLRIDSFSVIRHDFMLTSSGAPKREYSDHFPILVSLKKE